MFRLRVDAALAVLILIQIDQINLQMTDNMQRHPITQVTDLGAIGGHDAAERAKRQHWRRPAQIDRANGVADSPVRLDRESLAADFNRKLILRRLQLCKEFKSFFDHASPLMRRTSPRRLFVFLEFDGLGSFLRFRRAPQGHLARIGVEGHRHSLGGVAEEYLRLMCLDRRELAGAFEFGLDRDAIRMRLEDELELDHASGRRRRVEVGDVGQGFRKLNLEAIHHRAFIDVADIDRDQLGFWSLIRHWFPL